MSNLTTFSSLLRQYLHTQKKHTTALKKASESFSPHGFIKYLLLCRARAQEGR